MHTSPGIVSPIVNSKKIKKHLRYPMCVARGRPELVFFFVFKTSAETSHVVGSPDCRHFCDDEESHHETLMQVTMSMKTTVQHRVVRIVGSCFPFSTVLFFGIWNVRSLKKSPLTTDTERSSSF